MGISVNWPLRATRCRGAGASVGHINTWINDRGDVAFGGHVAGEECMPIGFVGCGESIYFKSQGGTLQSIAHQGEQAPQGGTYAYAWGAVLNNRGDSHLSEF